MACNPEFSHLPQEAVKETAKAMKALTELSSQVWAEGIRDALQQNGASAPLAATNGCRMPLPLALNLLRLHLLFICSFSPVHEWQCKVQASCTVCRVALQRGIGGNWAGQRAIQCRQDGCK